jgi:osmoprotectant transport system substrate-binding protein
MRKLLVALASLALAAGLLACGGGAATTTTAPGAQPGRSRPAVTLGTDSSPEQLVLGQLYKQALEAKGFTVAMEQSIGSTQLAAAALRSGRIELYPAYVGTFDATFAGDDKAFPTAAAAFAAGQAYARAHGDTLLARTPFANGDALAVTPAYASAHHLTSIAGLKAIRGLRLGATPEFHQRQAGLPGLARAYGITRVTFAPLTVPLQYQALDDGMIDTAAVSTTDGQLQGGRYVVLKDPKGVFGFQNVAPVVSSKVLAAEGTAFRRTLDAVSAKLTTPAMRQMNAAVAGGRRSPAAAAQTFLAASGLG